MLQTMDNLSPELAPELEQTGITLRRWRDAADFEPMARVLYASHQADGIEEARTAQDLAQMYGTFKNFDPTRDLLLVEHAGELVAYSGSRWWEEHTHDFVHPLWLAIVPEWRGRGLEYELLRQTEQQAWLDAQAHPNAPTWYNIFVGDKQVWLEQAVRAAGYQAVRYFYEMVRPNLENIPEPQLPPGIEVRPVTPDQYYQIWQASVEAFQEHWGEQVHDESDYQRWLQMPHFNSALWQVAWSGDEVVGMVLNFVDEKANREFNRKRGHTEDISVRHPWRGRGIAKALLLRSLHMFREMGLDSTTLGVDVENPTGALRLYQNVGYVTEHTVTVYRKQVPGIRVIEPSQS